MAMAKAKYAYCEIADIRVTVAAQLKLSPEKPETAAEFWARVERAGQLQKALTLFDQVAAKLAARRQVRRETRQGFAQRVKQEGRQAEAERLRAELLEAGLTQREVQVELVKRVQPLDGSQTCAWVTPDPWEAGRLFRRKADERRLLSLEKESQHQDDDDYDDYDDDDDDQQVYSEELNRLAWARHRRDERCALAAARRRARALTAAAPE
jgi:hypothetical protein